MHTLSEVAPRPHMTLDVARRKTTANKQTKQTVQYFEQVVD